MTEDLRPVPRRFRRVLRGYEPDEVDAYVQSLQNRLMEWEMRYRDLEQNIVSRTQTADAYLEAASALLISTAEVVGESPVPAPPPPSQRETSGDSQPQDVSADVDPDVLTPDSGESVVSDTQSGNDDDDWGTEEDSERTLESKPDGPQPQPEGPREGPDADFDILEILDSDDDEAALAVPEDPDGASGGAPESAHPAPPPPPEPPPPPATGPEPREQPGMEQTDPDDSRPWAPPAG